MRKVFLGLLAALMVVSVVWIFIGKSKKSAPTIAAAPGVTKDKIIIGSSAALTGFAGFLGSEYIKGAMSYINEVNQTGGVNGRKIEVISYDDAYDPALAVVNTQKLINQDKVFALFNYVGTPTAVKVMPLVDEAKIPLIGLFTGANALRNPLDKNIFNIRASYYQETGTFIKGVVEELKLSKIAVFYQYDAYGFDGLKGAQLALEKYNLKSAAEASFERGILNVEAALEAIKASNAEAVVMIGTYSPIARFVKLARAGGFNPIFHSVSFVGSEAFAKELGAAGDGVVVTQVVPPPVEKNLLYGVDDYLVALKKYYPDSDTSFGSLEGYVNAVILVEGIKRAGTDPTREKLITALESIDNYALGLASPVSFSADNHQGMNRVYLTYIKDGKFVLFSDWQEYKKAQGL